GTGCRRPPILRGTLDGWSQSFTSLKRRPGTPLPSLVSTGSRPGDATSTRLASSTAATGTKWSGWRISPTGTPARWSCSRSTVAGIDEGEPVSVMGGRVLTNEEFAAHISGADRWSAAAVDEGINVLQADDDPLSRGNHSCDPNLWMSDEVTLAARRTIRVGEE